MPKASQICLELSSVVYAASGVLNAISSQSVSVVLLGHAGPFFLLCLRIITHCQLTFSGRGE